MATDKLAEGIRNFAADTRKLEADWPMASAVVGVRVHKRHVTTVARRGWVGVRAHIDVSKLSVPSPKTSQNTAFSGGESALQLPRHSESGATACHQPRPWPQYHLPHIINMY